MIVCCEIGFRGRGLIGANEWNRHGRRSDMIRAMEYFVSSISVSEW